jgi:hypothetical protein
MSIKHLIILFFYYFINQEYLVITFILKLMLKQVFDKTITYYSLEYYYKYKLKFMYYSIIPLHQVNQIYLGNILNRISAKRHV